MCVISLCGLKYCHNHMLRVGSAAADDDADGDAADIIHAESAADAASLEIGGGEGDKSHLIQSH